jgi:hypothetical protein
MSNAIDGKGLSAQVGAAVPGVELRAGMLDPQALEAILRATLSQQQGQALAPQLDAIIRSQGDREPDDALVSEIVAAALEDFWPAVAAAQFRQATLKAVTVQLLEDPSAMHRIRQLLASQRGGQ